jgi:CLASP N terminal/HEAT repeat
LLPQVVAMYVKLCSSDSSLSNSSKYKASSAMMRALACCITHPVSCNFHERATDEIEKTIRKVLDYVPATDALSQALFQQSNIQSLDVMELRRSAMLARDEGDGKFTSPGGPHGMNCNCVRRIATMLATRPLLPQSAATTLILMHVGTSLKLNGQQRATAEKRTKNLLKAVIDGKNDDKDVLANFISQIVANDAASFEAIGDKGVGDSIHSASLSLIVSLGRLAANFSPLTDDPDASEMVPFAFAMGMLKNQISSRLSDITASLVDTIENLSEEDVSVYRTPKGTLFVEQETKTDSNGNTIDYGKSRRTEDEEWELQMKRELARKRESESAGKPATLSAEDKKKIEEQDLLREKIGYLINMKFKRTLSAIDTLVSSDIEIGNACLPTLSPNIVRLSVSSCTAMQQLPVLKDDVVETLTCLATCVYEIQEEYAPMMAVALTISLRKGNDEVSVLPSRCEPAATTVFEMDEFQEQLSGPSFAFLFPVIQAALMGPRTTPGCEGALRVMERHTVMLAGEETDPNVKPLRAEMVTSVLELLKHDRSQAFVDPTPYDTLVACYRTEDNNENASGPALTTSELAPLLDDRGALGTKNCRVGSMIALRSIATQNIKIVKNNPLIENRIWLNCFDENELILEEARRTWHVIQDTAEDNGELPPPSAMYAIPLLPLLHNPDTSIANAAASAYARGMKVHQGTVSRNIQRLCNTYIDSTPQPGDGDDRSVASATSSSDLSVAKASVAAPKKKPLISTGLKKKTVKKSALDVAGIGQPKKKVTKKKALNSALLKPKQERTLDQAALESQFKTGPKEVEPEDDSPEKIAIRSGVVGALSKVPTVSLDMDFETLKLLSSFLMAYGIADGEESIKNASRNALRDIIATYGASDDAIGFLLPHLDEILKNGAADVQSLGSLSAEKIPRTPAASNCRKEGAVVALGSVALHLKGPENASKIDQTIDMLLSSLKTPNEDVQASVADALSKLMKKGNTQDRIQGIIGQLLEDCLDGASAPIRRGAAYGIAASVKGSGIATLKKYGVVTKLEEACASGSATNKEGCLFAIQLLCTRLGLLFEPYVIVLLPSLLKSFGDGSDVVRRAASRTVGVIMSKLSAHGVKLVMPAVLTAFNDSNWRTKQASINMLGSMSHLAPKQLASALPKVVPKLIEAFADTHTKVKASAQGALDEISGVIRNPEIHEISNVLLKALTDPADNTLQALEALIATEFLHAIDAPSLALIVPILHRGLRDRAATTKRYGALITGNLCTMINDPRDFVPYLPTLMPDLQSSLLDPIPDVRSIAAKALGSLTRGLGEQSLPDLRGWLIENLRSEDISSAERSGAAQGLTEVLIASGTATVEEVMIDDILPLKSHPSPATREGVLWVLVFLPPAMGQGFTALLDSSLPALINGLSDDNEQVRDVAMRAGRVLIKSHGKVHFDKILPILRNGMIDEDYRIRLSSLMLLGDLLSMIGGTTVLRTDGDTQDDIRRAERAQAQLTLTLGIQTRNRVLSDIYLARSDNAHVVRQGAVQVWKTVVSVTARTLRQILQVLVSRVVSDLASGDPEKTEVAGKCLGDIVSKLGESVLQDIIPVLRNALYDGDSSTRRGVCVGLTEVIGSSTKEQILRYLDIIVKVVQDALCDDDSNVREMAASSYQNLYGLVGNRAMDEVVPSLMVALENTDGDDLRRSRALNGLTGILSIRSKELLPYIIPRLIQRPITMHHAQALSSIAAVTGSTLYYHFNAIIPALMNDLANKSGGDKDTETAVRGCVESVFANSGEAGVNTLVSQIVGSCTSDKAEMRMESCWMMEVLTETRKYETIMWGQSRWIQLMVLLGDEKKIHALQWFFQMEQLSESVLQMRFLSDGITGDLFDTLLIRMIIAANSHQHLSILFPLCVASRFHR